MASTAGITERKRAQAALEQATNRLELLTLATQDAVFDWDLVAHEVWCNENYHRLFGAPEMSPESANSWVERLHPEDLERIAKARNAAMGPEGKPFLSEYRLRRPDGSYADVVERSFIVRDAQGQPLRMIGALTDVTELRGAEKALKASEQRYRDLFENAINIVFTSNLQGYITSVNESGEQSSGYTRAELTRMNVLQLLAPEYVEEGRRVMEGLAAGMEPGIGEWEVVTKDGHQLWLEVSLRLVRRSGELVEVQGIARDITKRKRAEEALRQSEARFRVVFENAAIGIALVDTHGHPMDSNPALQKMLGYSKSELAQMALPEYTHPDDAQASWDLFTGLAEGKRDQYELQEHYRRKDRQIVWGQLTVSLVRNQNGEPQYAIEMVEDITTRKRAVEALRELSGRLLRLQDQERRRIARELHDSTAQRLAALAMNLSVVMKSAQDLSPRARTCLSGSLELAEECSREIRTLSYLLHPPLLDEVGLGSALRWFVDGYTQRTGIDVDLEMPPQFARLPEDIELALYRVVQEGLTNIHLHSGSNKAHICLKCRADQAVLTVADEGHGLPPGLVDRGGRRVAKLGVGISGMRERIRQLGGQFEIDTGSKGTTLRAIVPLGEHQT
jgi:PAS domain S-box-containing protein